MNELIIDVENIDKIPFSKEQLLDENNIITFKTTLGMDKKVSISITGLQFKYLVTKDSDFFDDILEDDNLVQLDVFCNELLFDDLLMYESTEDIRHYLKLIDIKESFAKKIDELFMLLDNGNNGEIKLNKNYQTFLDQILKAIINNDDALEAVLDYMMKNHDFDVSEFDRD